MNDRTVRRKRDRLMRYFKRVFLGLAILLGATLTHGQVLVTGLVVDRATDSTLSNIDIQMTQPVLLKDVTTNSGTFLFNVPLGTRMVLVKIRVVGFLPFREWYDLTLHKTLDIRLVKVPSNGSEKRNMGSPEELEPLGWCGQDHVTKFGDLDRVKDTIDLFSVDSTDISVNQLPMWLGVGAVAVFFVLDCATPVTLTKLETTIPPWSGPLLPGNPPRPSLKR